MSFENLVNEMRNKVIQENNAEQEFLTSVENELCQALRSLASSTFEAMKKDLAKHIILNPQNQSCDYYQVPSKTSFRVWLPSEYRFQDMYKNYHISGVTNRLDITFAKVSEDYVYYDVKLLEPGMVCHKTMHFKTFYTHLQYLAEKEGFHLSDECSESSGRTPHIKITYQRTITPQGTITNQRTIPQPVTNAPKENENGSSKPNRLARAGDIIETLLLYSWVGLIVVALIIFFLCR